MIKINMTINEMKEAIDGLFKAVRAIDFKAYQEVMALQERYIHDNGYNRDYISTNARKAEVETHLKGLRMAIKVVMGV